MNCSVCNEVIVCGLCVHNLDKYAVHSYWDGEVCVWDSRYSGNRLLRLNHSSKQITIEYIEKLLLLV
jgi:hypothetical protein